MEGNDVITTSLESNQMSYGGTGGPGVTEAPRRNAIWDE